MRNLYRGPSIDASYEVSVHLSQRFHRRRFLEIGQSETIVNCLWGFQRRRLKCEKLTDDGSQVMAKAHFAYSKVS